MSDFPYTIRNYNPDDFGSYLRLNLEANKIAPPVSRVSPQYLRERMDMPGYFPGLDLFVAELSGELVGYIGITRELSIGRVVLDCLVHPKYRRKSLATGLYHYAIRHAAGLGAQVAHVHIVENNSPAASLLSKLGFRFVRRFLEQRLLLSGLHLPDTEHTGLLCHHLQRGEEDKLTDIQNYSFTGTWGFSPNTIEEIIYRVNLAGCSPEDVILADEADMTIGYCWTTIALHEEADLSTDKGRICMLGVHPEHQGKGIGRILLSVGLSYLKSKGINVVELTVDSQNAPACALYNSAGFRIASNSLWYEKELY